MTYYAKPQIVDLTAAISAPALTSLQPHHFAMAAAALPVLGPGWSLDAEVDYDGDLSLVITRTADIGDDTSADAGDDTSFVLYSGGHALIRLGKIAGDGWEGLGCFTSIGNAVRAIAADRALSGREEITNSTAGGSRLAVAWPGSARPPAIVLRATREAGGGRAEPGQDTELRCANG
jgi:hypothetical protein